MKPQNLLAAVLVVIGIVAFAYQGITYTLREKAVDLGSIQITAEKVHTIPLPPIVGSIALVSGLLLLVVADGKALLLLATYLIITGLSGTLGFSLGQLNMVVPLLAMTAGGMILIGK